MIVNLLIYAVAVAFSVYVIVTACRNFVGYNPTAPSAWARLKAWWPGFVKRNIVDDDPYDDESHAATRYRHDDYIDWATIPEKYNVVVLQGPGWYAGEGAARMFQDMTLVSCADDDMWDGTGGSDVPGLAIIGPLPPWRESLLRRPGK